MCIVKQACRDASHGDAFGVSVLEHHFLPLVLLDLFCYLLWS